MEGWFDDTPTVIADPMDRVPCPVCEGLFLCSEIEGHVNLCLTTMVETPVKKKQGGDSSKHVKESEGSPQNVIQWAEWSVMQLDKLMNDPAHLTVKELDSLENALKGYVNAIERAEEAIETID